MEKIAILVNQDTMNRCSCSGCLRAFFDKEDAFSVYEGQDIELVSLSHSGGDLEKKLGQLAKKGVTKIHLSTCTRSKNNDYESIANQCAEAGFDVIGYTHGGSVSKEGKPAIVLQGYTQKRS